MENKLIFLEFEVESLDTKKLSKQQKFRKKSIMFTPDFNFLKCMKCQSPLKHDKVEFLHN